MTGLRFDHKLSLATQQRNQIFREAIAGGIACPKPFLLKKMLASTAKSGSIHGHKTRADSKLKSFA